VTANNSIPGTSKMSTSTAIHPLELNTNLINSKTTTETASKSTSPNQQRGHLQQQQPLWKQQQQQTINGKKRFTNKSLLILKSGKRVYAGSKECYQFADTGACRAGIFCVFEHGKSLKHMQQKICQRFFFLNFIFFGSGNKFWDISSLLGFIFDFFYPRMSKKQKLCLPFKKIFFKRILAFFLFSIITD